QFLGVRITALQTIGRSGRLELAYDVRMIWAKHPFNPGQYFLAERPRVRRAVRLDIKRRELRHRHEMLHLLRWVTFAGLARLVSGDRLLKLGDFIGELKRIPILGPHKRRYNEEREWQHELRNDSTN